MSNTSPYGPTKTLFLALQASAFMQGVSLDYGEEKISGSDLPPPRVVMVPRGGPWYEPENVREDDGTGTLSPVNQSIGRLFGCSKTIEFYLWAKSTDPAAQPIDEVNEVEALAVMFASALGDQRAMSDVLGNVAYGLVFKIVREDDVNIEGQNAYGRALKITVVVDVPRIPAPSPDAEVTQTNFIMLPLNRTPG